MHNSGVFLFLVYTAVLVYTATLSQSVVLLTRLSLRFSGVRAGWQGTGGGRSRREGQCYSGNIYSRRWLQPGGVGLHVGGFLVDGHVKVTHGRRILKRTEIGKDKGK